MRTRWVFNRLGFFLLLLASAPVLAGGRQTGEGAKIAALPAPLVQNAANKGAGTKGKQTRRGPLGPYRGRVLWVTDGDSLAVDVPGWPEPFKQTGLRLAGIDAPEVGWRALCEKERLAGQAARQFLLELAPPGAWVQFWFLHHD